LSSATHATSPPNLHIAFPTCPPPPPFMMEIAILLV
jgi:hypothetical protein